MLKNERNINYLREQIIQAENRAKAYVFDENNKARPQQSIFLKFSKYLKDFEETRSAARWVVFTGLRGAGKTTVLSQLFYHYKNLDGYRLFLSVDQITQILGSSLNEILEAYEELLGFSFEQLDKPLYLFLDEVQYDDKWGVVLKSLYDRSNKIFILATGSAALLLNNNSDIARRAIFEKLFPLSFTEYLKIRNNRFEIKGLGKSIRSALFNSSTAAEAHNNLLSLEPEIKKYWLGVDKQEVTKYIKYGSLPFMVALKNEALIYDQVNKTLDKIINSDVAKCGRFNSEIISKIPSLLYAIADMDELSFNKLAGIFEISRPKIMEIFEILESTETITRVYPHGSHLNQIKKIRQASKFLFASSAFRAMYYNMVGNIIGNENYRGKLLEDVVGMYLNRLLYKKINVSITYDSAQGGADFIVGWERQRIIIEVGSGDKGARQIKNTMAKVEARYGFTISSNYLNLIRDENILQVPLEYFLLV
ncbi:MAG: AAA family ATPase [Patescibacteria group bacterium]